MSRAADQAARDAAILERDRNVVIDAGAGTGKTATIVRRIVELVAPSDDGDALTIDRVAAITFTRKAAGELGQRIRKALAAQLRRNPSQLRATRLRKALHDIDTAYVGTIHAFADRLLRELADRSGLGPAYEILEDIEGLTNEVTTILLQAAAGGTMADALGGTAVAGDHELAAEVAETIRLAQRAGLRAHTGESIWVSHPGLNALFSAFCLHRDNPPPRPDPVEPDLEAIAAAIAELRGAHDGLSLEGQHSKFGRWLRRYLRYAERAVAHPEPAQLYRVVSRPLDRLASWDPKKGADCAGDADAFYVVKRLAGKKPNQGHADRGEVAYDRENLQGPLVAWLGHRLVRTAPAVVALYQKLQSERQAVDQIDLMLRLRNLLRDDIEARRKCQARLDHVFVDEFQDTDPLQAEIVLYLVEDSPTAAHWADVVPRPGKLTIVGDPKQSIYRFRRADVVMYDRVRRKLLEREADVLSVELTTNFRSVPPLIDWFGDRCADLLGRAPDAETRFDPATGRVYHQPLVAGRKGEPGPAVEVLPIDPTAGTGGKANVDARRAVAAEAIAKWIRRFLDDPEARIVDPHDGVSRRPRAGDVAVLTPATTKLDPVFEALDRLGIAHAASGGRLFFDDALHQTFVLALRGLAGYRDVDVDDGAALAALYSPPVFGLDPGTFARGRTKVPEGEADPFPEARARVREVDEIVSELRSHRDRRSPGETARALIERSALGRTVALGANGPQRLRRLYEVCLVLDQQAKHDGLDFDEITRELREALEDPPRLDAPPPLDGHAVPILTIHQAKGLEFPVVILWDCTAKRQPIVRRPVWSVDREGEHWSMALEGLVHDTRTADRDLEAEHLTHEWERLYYVACTRARDRLVLTTPAQPKGKWPVMHSILVPGGAADQHSAQRVFETHTGLGSSWGDRVEAPQRIIGSDSADPYSAVRERWVQGCTRAGEPIARPLPVSTWAHRNDTRSDPVDDTEPEAVLVAAGAEILDATSASPPVRRRGRYGPAFGNTVHGALEAILRHGLSVAAAVERSARTAALPEALHPDARDDVGRALEALRSAGVLGREAMVIRPEYPVVGRGDPGDMLLGVIDLIACDDQTLWILDYKTDQPPSRPVTEELPHYVAQIRAYARIIHQANLASGRELTLGLLFTADGTIHRV
jgi:ATP-dependent helicase/nuclease subunit A